MSEVMTTAIGDLMERSGVGFGTSGARGLVADMTDEVCYAYTLGFLQHMEASGSYKRGGSVAIGGDLRPSTPRIMAAVAAAVRDFGHEVVNCGFLPTPALAHYGLLWGVPSIMVTGSHIPFDRNGIKFYSPTGEILKADEEAIRTQTVALDKARIEQGLEDGLPPVEEDAARDYIKRYTNFFPAGALKGARIGFYEHSSVARDLLAAIFEGLGAEVIRLERTDEFTPVDTEAIRPEDMEKARKWAAEGNFDCIVSADGDGDRPMVSDEKGEWIRGDVAGILCARYLGARILAVPVSCNTAVEATGWFENVVQTRIGSPYVIEAMNRDWGQTPNTVAGYEANGGFLLGTPAERDGRHLDPLPTRDAAIVPLALLAQARESGAPLSKLVAALPARYTYSDRLKEFPTEISRTRLLDLGGPTPDEAKRKVEALFGDRFGAVAGIDTTDGVRITFDDGRISHLRGSGNAPELRCYAEAESPERARRMAEECLRAVDIWRHG